MADLTLRDQFPVGTSEAIKLPGGTREPTGGVVSTDGTTITGDGTAQDPLAVANSIANAQGRTFVGVIPASGFGPIIIVPGMVLTVGANAGISASSRPVTPAGSPNAVIGVALTGGGPTALTPITVQEDGIVTLTAAQWQAAYETGITHASGDVVFVSQINTGKLTTTTPTALQTSTLVGRFLNLTDLKLLEGPPLLGSAF